jgi:hypothetical protein
MIEHLYGIGWIELPGELRKGFCPSKFNPNYFLIWFRLSLGLQRLANLYEKRKDFEKKVLKIVFFSNCLR